MACIPWMRRPVWTSSSSAWGFVPGRSSSGSNFIPPCALYLTAPRMQQCGQVSGCSPGIQPYPRRRACCGFICRAAYRYRSRRCRHLSPRASHTAVSLSARLAVTDKPTTVWVQSMLIEVTLGACDPSCLWKFVVYNDRLIVVLREIHLLVTRVRLIPFLYIL